MKIWCGFSEILRFSEILCGFSDFRLKTLDKSFSKIKNACSYSWATNLAYIFENLMLVLRNIMWILHLNHKSADILETLSYYHSNSLITVLHLSDRFNEKLKFAEFSSESSHFRLSSMIFSQKDVYKIHIICSNIVCFAIRCSTLSSLRERSV